MRRDFVAPCVKLESAVVLYSLMVRTAVVPGRPRPTRVSFMGSVKAFDCCQMTVTRLETCRLGFIKALPSPRLTRQLEAR